MDEIWKFNLLEVIDMETRSRVKMKMLVNGLEKYGENPTNKYPYLYLLERTMKEVEKRDWLIRDESLAKNCNYLKEKMINRTIFNEKKDREVYESGIYGYFVELHNFRPNFRQFIQGVRNFEKEW